MQRNIKKKKKKEEEEWPSLKQLSPYFCTDSLVMFCCHRPLSPESTALVYITQHMSKWWSHTKTDGDKPLQHTKERYSTVPLTSKGGTELCLSSQTEVQLNTFTTNSSEVKICSQGNLSVHTAYFQCSITTVITSFGTKCY